MIEINLTNWELFLNFIEIENENCYLDLHNDFECVLIEYADVSGGFYLNFKAVSNPYSEVEISFFNAEFGKIKIEMANDSLVSKSKIVDTLYRGRFETPEGELLEKSLTGKNYYYISFVDDTQFEVFSNNVIARVKDSTQ
jgi:hypothetical protein